MNEKTQWISRRTVLASAGAAAAATLVDGHVSPGHAAAEMLGPSTPTHFRFKLGEFEVTTILDGAIQVPTVNKIFGQDQKAEDVAALAASEAVEDLSIRVDVEARRLLVVEGTESLPIRPRLLQLDVAGDEGHDVGPVSDFLDGRFRDQIRPLANDAGMLVHAASHLLERTLARRRFLLLLPDAGLVVVLAPPQLRQDARLLAGLLEALHGAPVGLHLGHGELRGTRRR